ncbi:MAG TPA: bifunctional (p)ppGpp synthetase/guanosine-3',5'-bis(diphosphate) 3'-pyrophosphohydrolase [Sulfurihydrogenibium azorense]|uniref:Bifunctional (P)ppGpp synthetase/guanosine-3',5'-bis(Diphosphate) 3'-pyrophosphohydrolase n=1 Tax=Sulfurihydrogenibium azorense TaxID=309806 RepID=A0A831YCB0_9AQUI|nr:bifunctional (p)ppGpp synthetase/guanosine-3',5'-bis(diphosphate) 3'-pyrophosphohydrolase [Sulfurihydrogenibium azorense]
MEDKNDIFKAIDFVIEKHKNQFRKSGEPYYIHPIEVAKILADLKMDKASIIAGLLHDIVEDTDTTLQDIEELFGKKVAQLVDGVTKINKYQFDNIESAKIENFRKFIVSSVNDIRVIVIKLADRLHNLRTLNFLREEKQKAIAKESLEIYSPLAGRLGLWNIKREIDDLSFMYLYPEEYKKVVSYFAISKEATEKYLKEKVIPQIQELLDQHNIKAQIHYRAKHLYSIYEKTIRKNLKLNDIYDIFGVRLIVDSVKDCYVALGLIHSKWTPVPGKFKDYISLPKSNFYQALHTTVVGPEGKFVEIQIKTHEMHKIAEEGIAAHWIYKGSKGLTEKDLESFNWLKNILEALKSSEDPEVLQDISKDLTREEIYVFTPKGDLIKLPAGSTIVDFAYAIHTQIGHKAVGGKVNGKFVPLDTRLKNGDIVEVITKEGRKPSRDWLKFVVTSKAKTNIKQYLSKIQRENSIKFGEKLLDKLLKKINQKVSTLTEEDKNKIISRFNYKTFEDLLIAIADGKLSPLKVINVLKPEENIEKLEDKSTLSDNSTKDLYIEIDNINNVMSFLAKCCNPIPGDDVIGVVTKGKGIAVHNKSCKNVKQIIENQPERIINIKWKNNLDKYIARIKVLTEDKPGVLASISNTIASENSNIKSVKVENLKGDKALINFSLEIKDKNHLDRILNSIRSFNFVIDAKRV